MRPVNFVDDHDLVVLHHVVLGRDGRGRAPDAGIKNDASA